MTIKENNMNVEIKKHYLIYKITNKINGKIYIGKHITTNINDHYMGSGKYISQAIKEEGIDNFEKTILFECSSEEEMNNKEAEIVNEDFIHRNDTYNIVIGGSGGWSYNNTILKNNGIKNFLKNKSKEEIQKIREKAKKNSLIITKSNAFSIKQSEKLKEHFKTHEAHFKGMHHSKESKKKISMNMQGKLIGKANGNFNHHWWKDPNDKTKFRSIKEGDPVPEGWIRGKWQPSSK